MAAAGERGTGMRRSLEPMTGKDPISFGHDGRVLLSGLLRLGWKRLRHDETELGEVA